MELSIFSPKTTNDKFFPLVLSPVPAGTPQEVEDAFEHLNLNDYVSSGADDVFYITVQGDSMIEYGIYDGDLLVAERGRQPQSGDVVIAEINGSFTVKRFVRWQRNLFLAPENGSFKTRRIEEHEDFAVWGVVTHVVHKF